tara:strand:- start:331 stop:1329 length:999 start_codon:yes stop_codon:yes gene_type:complete
MDLNNKVVLVTGGTGSFGKKFVKNTLQKFNLKKIIILSRDEMKQWEMAREYQDNKKVRFFIGDVRERARLFRAFEGVDVVVHAAATKIVPTAEYNPFECIKTNINGAMNVIDAAIDCKVERVVALSTDKASSPINLYGATKLASDKLFIAANNYSGKKTTTFSVVRYGNVMGSRGSIIPFFLSLKGRDKIPITDIRMSRFMISLEQGIELVWKAIDDSLGGEIYVKKIPSMKVIDIVKVLCPNQEIEIIGIRPGEKLHEQMIGIEDAPYTFEYEDYYKILPSIYDAFKDKKRIGKGKSLSNDFSYTSDNNPQWMDEVTLSKWLSKESEAIER